jgi:formate/nitrite transporter FocA (FNT family)
MELGFLVMLASVLGACSDHSFVIGNVSSGLLVFGLFYTTLNLKRGEKKRP